MLLKKRLDKISDIYNLCSQRMCVFKYKTEGFLHKKLKAHEDENGIIVSIYVGEYNGK